MSTFKNRGYSLSMPIAITGDHRTLAESVSDFLTERQARAAARAGSRSSPGSAGPAAGRSDFNEVSPDDVFVPRFRCLPRDPLIR
jgi:hypothetical protein